MDYRHCLIVDMRFEGLEVSIFENAGDGLIVRMLAFSAVVCNEIGRQGNFSKFYAFKKCNKKLRECSN